MSTMINRLRDREGSTLIEVIVVVVILAILAAVMLPQFFGKTEDANESAARSDLNTAAKYAGIDIAEGGDLASAETAAEAVQGITGVVDPGVDLTLSSAQTSATIEVEPDGTITKTGW